MAGQVLGTALTSAVTAGIRPTLVAIALGGAAIILGTVLLAAFRARLPANRSVTPAPTWDCGYLTPTARMQYTASSFAWPIVTMFRWVLRPARHTPLDPGNFPRHGALDSHTDDLFRRHLLEPLFRAVAISARSLHGLQQGRNQLYVLLPGDLRADSPDFESELIMTLLFSLIHVAPALVLAPLVPAGDLGAALAFPGDFLFLAYALGLMRFSTVPAALDTGSAFEGMGASRKSSSPCWRKRRFFPAWRCSPPIPASSASPASAPASGPRRCTRGAPRCWSSPPAG